VDRPAFAARLNEASTQHRLVMNGILRNPSARAQSLARARRHPSFVVGTALTALLILTALLSLVWQPYPPGDINIPDKLQAPSAAHWLGTDSLGRDIASQLLVGSQNSILVGVIAVGIGLLLGLALGCLAAAQNSAGRAWVDEIIMRAADFSFAFPALLTAIMLTAIYGPGLLMSIVAIGIFNIPVFARITRAGANSVWRRDFVTAARAAGKGPWAITRDHVLPNIASPLIVQATISFATAILAEAALSFLGLGTQPPQPSWGRMLNDAQTMMFQAPMLAVYPGVAIMLSVLGLNLMGDGLRDLMDPKLTRQR
jgi:peptide/nickel transport system permease protein